MTIEKRKLGLSGIDVAPLCLGGNVFGWTADEKTSFALLDAFVAAGFGFIDTADVYSSWMPGHEGGESETMIGNWLAARGGRQRVVIATKVGMLAKFSGLKAANIIAACDASLKRLRTDYIDLYQSHQDDPETPQDETLEAFGKLVSAGKVRAIGASNFDVARLEAAERIAQEGGFPRYNTLQPLYNLVDRDFEKTLQPLCVEEEIGVIPYYSLAAGFLTGKYTTSNPFPKTDVRSTFDEERFRQWLVELEEIRKNELPAGVPMAQWALAWCLRNPLVSCAIPGCKNLAQLEINASAAKLIGQ